MTSVNTGHFAESGRADSEKVLYNSIQKCMEVQYIPDDVAFGNVCPIFVFKGTFWGKNTVLHKKIR